MLRMIVGGQFNYLKSGRAEVAKIRQKLYDLLMITIPRVSIAQIVQSQKNGCKNWHYSVIIAKVCAELCEYLREILQNHAKYLRRFRTWLVFTLRNDIAKVFSDLIKLHKVINRP
jgi:hypothetical protein